MDIRQRLSKKSNKFLEDLNAYLFAKGKNFKEIDVIIEELEVHLLEAERKGKPIEKVVGNSPGEYMEMISEEMPVDYSNWIKYAVIIILGSFTFQIFMDILNGPLSYSILEIVGDVTISILFILLILVSFRWITKSGMSDRKGILLLTPVMMVPIAMFVGLIYLNRHVETPVIHFGVTGSWLIVSLASILVIAITLWAKSWVLVVILSLLILPEFLLGLTSLSIETQLIVSTIISYGGIFLYIWIVSRREK